MLQACKSLLSLLKAENPTTVSIYAFYIFTSILHKYDDHNLQFYLCRPVNYMFKPLISRYRLHAHSLNIETGRNYIQLLTFNEIYS